MNNEVHHHTPRTARHDILNHPKTATAVTALLIGTTAVGIGMYNEVVKADTCEASNETYTVQPGDTLWDIALEIDPNEDPQATMRHLIKVNPDLASIDVLQQGVVLELPLCGDELPKE